MNQFEKPNMTRAEQNPEAEAERALRERSQEMLERPKKNDLILREHVAAEAKRIAYQLGIKFEMKRMAEAKTDNHGSTVPGEFILRITENPEENAEKAFKTLREAKLDPHIMREESLDLDKEGK